jgi:hypothetical protein
MSTTSDSLGRRASRALTRLVVTLLVLALLGAVVFLLSQLNARTFSLETVGGNLVVMKGRMLPMGSEPYRPSDPALAAAYAPFDLAGGSAGGLTGARFDERDAMDRALFTLLEGLARPKLVSDDAQTLAQGLAFLSRMQKLGGVSDDQRRTLRTLESEVAFFQARSKLDEARRDIGEALAQLRLSADSSSRHARAAHRMMAAIEPAANALEDALRRAVYTLDSDAEVGVSPPGAVLSPAPAPAAPDAGSRPRQ